MVKISLLGALAVFVAITTAVPSDDAGLKEYHLKTKIICGDPTKEGLYGIGSLFRSSGSQLANLVQYQATTRAPDSAMLLLFQINLSQIKGSRMALTNNLIMVTQFPGA